MSFLIIPFIVSFLILLVFLKTPLRHLALDEPNHRSLHNKVIPRTGGLSIMLGVSSLFFRLIDLRIWLAIAAILVVVSLIDDIRGLSVRWRFLFQILVSLFFVFYFMPGWHIGIKVISVFSLVWMLNLYNFMDGSDGLAGGMSFFGFSIYAIAAFHLDNQEIFLMCACISSASLAFLIFNFNPAKIFMGDSGSVPLGFFAGSIGLYGNYIGLWALWFPVLVFSPFIVDSTVTLLKRLFRGEKIWQAHREHYYQRLIQLGWGHKKTALAEYALMILVGCSSILMLRIQHLDYLILILWVIIYIFLLLFIDNAWHKKSEK